MRDQIHNLNSWRHLQEFVTLIRPLRLAIPRLLAESLASRPLHSSAGFKQEHIQASHCAGSSAQLPTCLGNHRAAEGTHRSWGVWATAFQQNVSSRGLGRGGSPGAVLSRGTPASLSIWDQAPLGRGRPPLKGRMPPAPFIPFMMRD